MSPGEEHLSQAQGLGKGFSERVTGSELVRGSGLGRGGWGVTRTFEAQEVAWAVARRPERRHSMLGKLQRAEWPECEGLGRVMRLVGRWLGHLEWGLHVRLSLDFVVTARGVYFNQKKHRSDYILRDQSVSGCSVD